MAELFPQPSLDDLCGEAVELVIRAKERFRPVATFALFSGGNDSTAMLHLVKDHVDAAVHIVTGIGIPETTDFVRATCAALGVRLIELRTDPSVYANIVLGPNAEGFPGPAWHGTCYQQLKQHRLRSLQTFKCFGQPGRNILLLSGIRNQESKRRAVKHPEPIDAPSGDFSRTAFAKPILRFDGRHLADYRELHQVLQGKVPALIHMSGDCVCGSMAKKGELPEIEFWFPETGKYIRELEREAERLGKPYCRWGWGHDKRAGVPAPGPLCQGCSLFPEVADGQ